MPTAPAIVERLEVVAAGPRARARARSLARAQDSDAVELVRRGARLGFAIETGSVVADESRALELWRSDRPILLRGWLARGVRGHGAAIRSTLAAFERLRRGATFQDFVWRRLARQRNFTPAGVAVDLGDTREIEKVFADARVRGRRTARDLYAKLSWISVDRRDVSLRIRFSFGAESLFEWFDDPRRSVWSDRFAASLFPESAVIERNAPLVALIERCLGVRARFSERIVYNNAPGGGATFHHDDEPHQRGVVYGQLAGETGWLALPKRELAAEIADFARSRRLCCGKCTARRALRLLDSEDAPALARLLNEDAAFAARLMERGAFFRLRPGDALLLPSHGPDDVCWHSVFALGVRPSLAHSYGIFAARRK